MGTIWVKVSIKIDDKKLIETARKVAMDHHPKIKKEYWSDRQVILRALEFYAFG